MIPMACTHRPEVFDLHQRNTLSNLQDLDGAEGSTSTPLLGILGFLAIHCGQAVSLLQSGENEVMISTVSGQNAM